MPLINKRLLATTVARHKHEFSSTSRETIWKHLSETLSLIDNKKFESEESEKVAFLMKLFELLGYKHHQNLSFEKSTKYRGSIDGQLTETDGTTQVAIEWKGTDTKDLERGGKAGETPVDQLFRYMSETKAAFGVVGNFIEIRLYSWDNRKDDYISFELRKLVNEDDHLDAFIYLLKPTTILKNNSKQCILKDLIDKTEKDQEEITKRFYNEYKDLRGRLFEHLVENNPVAEGLPLHEEQKGITNNGTARVPPQNHKHLLLEKTQKILDRMIFVMFCEDNQLLPMYTVKNTYQQAMSRFSRSETKVWDEFLGLFDAIDKGFPQQNIPAYNGGLFAPDPELEKLILKDEIFTGFVKLAEYFFDSDLDVNILGHIFEQSISDIEEMKEGLEVASMPSSPLNSEKPESQNGSQGTSATKPKTSKRKKDGIYYTPSYITEYIVKETVGRWLEDQQNSPSLKGWQTQSDGVVPRNTQNYLKLPYNPKLKEKARELRKAGNLSEVLLWNKIKQKSLLGLDFDRQKIIGDYIVDFYSPNLNLVIEIDGQSHDFKGEYDLKREKYLESLGLKIIHLEDVRIKKDLANVIQELYDFCNSLMNKTTPPANAGTPSKKGNNLSEVLQSIKILDPAGGSGAFMNQAHDYLAKKTVQIKTEQAGKDGLENFAPDVNTIDRSILNNNLFMVDLQPESVEIAKLSLWLKTARKDQKLNNLDANIKCGNSLIDDPEIAGEKAFDWEEEFGWLKGSDNHQNSANNK
jgi:very-short-patch-repair endonuclease